MCLLWQRIRDTHRNMSKINYYCCRTKYNHPHLNLRSCSSCSVILLNVIIFSRYLLSFIDIIEQTVWKLCFYFLAIYLSLIDMPLLWLKGALAVSKTKRRMVSRWPSVMNPFCIDEIPAVEKTISESAQTGAKWWGRPGDTSVFGPRSELCLALCLDDWLTSGDASLITSTGHQENERHWWWWQTLPFLLSCEQRDESFLLVPPSVAINVIKSCFLRHRTVYCLWNIKVAPRLKFFSEQPLFPCHLIWHQIWISLLHSVRFSVKKQTLVNMADLSQPLSSDNRADLPSLRACLHSFSSCHKVQNRWRPSESLTPARSR